MLVCSKELKHTVPGYQVNYLSRHNADFIVVFQLRLSLYNIALFFKQSYGDNNKGRYSKLLFYML